jgi:hypothetical protein
MEYMTPELELHRDEVWRAMSCLATQNLMNWRPWLQIDGILQKDPENVEQDALDRAERNLPWFLEILARRF